MLYVLGFVLSMWACGDMREAKGWCLSLLGKIMSGVLLCDISRSKGLVYLISGWGGAFCGKLLSTFMMNMLLVLLEVEEG